MRTDVLSFVLGSENRKNIARAILDYPKRQWSCSALEDLTKIPHATVFRALNGLKERGFLKSYKINKKDLVYELVSSPMTKELERVINIEAITTKKIAKNFVNKIRSKQVYSAILYGSSAKENSRPESDIDILIVLKKHNKSLEEKILNTAAGMSSDSNKTISLNIMDLKEIIKEKNSKFIESVINNMEILHGKKPF